MPEMMWWQDGSRWSFRCGINIDKIKNFMPETYKACQQNMPGVPEEHWQSHCGVPFCGAKFAPWKGGASNVVELNVGGEIHAMLAERLPEQLDDEIKKLLHEWHVAEGRVTPEDIMACIPEVLPKENLIKGSKIPGVARFDFETWKRTGCPTLLRAGWIALCKCIAMKDEINLSRIITLCDDLAIQEEQNPDLRSAMQMSRGIKPTKPITRPS